MDLKNILTVDSGLTFISLYTFGKVFLQNYLKLFKDASVPVKYTGRINWWISGDVREMIILKISKNILRLLY